MYVTSGIIERTQSKLERLLTPMVRKAVYKIVAEAIDEAWEAGHNTGWYDRQEIE